MGWLSRVEHYFRYHQTPKASMVDIAAIHLGREATIWCDWYKHTHGVPTWSRRNLREMSFTIDTRSCCIGGFLKQQPITILIDTGSTNNFVDSKVDARLMLQIEDYSRGREENGG
ncbi:hypothetical protein GW17_00048736 [Ensete ventricosum]|nr:hypothetical protein GW17_00048736 [Ensete ventricosum]RZR92234.1 hypothetical protein BHM03_00020499 [Ensete ventricosum]